MNFIIKISLNCISQRPYRTFKVHDSITLFELHKLIQIAFAWDDSHLFVFTRKDIEYADERMDGVDDEDEDDILDCSEIKLKDLNLIEKERFKYLYDFGDNWMHTIFIEKIEEGEKVIEYISGKGNTIMEDGQGIQKYNNKKVEFIKNSIKEFH